MADTTTPGYLNPDLVLQGVQTANLATKRNRLGLASQRDIDEWRIELETANAANQANYEMNRENNLLQRQLADQSYERSTAKNQLAELMAAGLTEMQARQAIAGAGEGATSFPVATTQAATAVPAAISPAGAGDSALSGSLLSGGLGMAGDMFGVLTQSLMAKDGGALGWSLAQPYMDKMTDLVDKGYLSPDDMATPADLIEYASGLEDGDAKNAILDVAHSKEAYHTAKSPLAHRALLSILKEQFGFKTSRAQIQETIARKNAESAASRLTEIQITGAGLDNVLKGLNIDYQQAQNEIAELLIDYQVSQNKIAQNEVDMSALDLQIKEKTSPLLIEETLARAQTAIAQYEIEYAYKRMNQSQIIQALENDLDVQIAMALANKVYWTNQQNAESAFGDTAFNEDGTMKALYRIYGSCKRFGATPATTAAQGLTAGAATAAATAGILKLFAPKPFKIVGFGR